MNCVWVTIEIPPRALFVKGRSAVDPDCLVAYVEGQPDKSVWIVDDGRTALGKPVERAHICGLDGDVYARRIDFPIGAQSPAEREK